jgi:hypothetical protein
MRRLLLLLLVGAVATSLTATVGAARSVSRAAIEGSSSAGVPVVRCPTVEPVVIHRVVPHILAVLGASSSTRGLDAYTNNGFAYLIGPAGMNCWGIQAVDGGSQVVAWPRGHSKPTTHARYAGLTISLDPACVSCKAADACPFFSQFSNGLGFGCSTGIPAGERVYGLRSNVALFEDPPGIPGDGWPSGGPDPANGLVGLNTSVSQDPAVFRSTCTLPAVQRWVCTVSLNDVLARYG